jgi:hypothetical protein
MDEFLRFSCPPDLRESESPSNMVVPDARPAANGTVEILRFAQDDNQCKLRACWQWTDLKIGHRSAAKSCSAGLKSGAYIGFTFSPGL